ncbi:unnamed protein product [Protopolystoma xenopodis]|uniref:Secreted protein n=1 Tax=Protopolystoma xenopodis TaxID=117903 RepID=A0A448WNJ3_9PLAT|nr:unnamed protein product [Protopolystoma xenopodis]
MKSTCAAASWYTLVTHFFLSLSLSLELELEFCANSIGFRTVCASPVDFEACQPGRLWTNEEPTSDNLTPRGATNWSTQDRLRVATTAPTGFVSPNSFFSLSYPLFSLAKLLTSRAHSYFLLLFHTFLRLELSVLKLLSHQMAGSSSYRAASNFLFPLDLHSLM